MSRRGQPLKIQGMLRPNFQGQETRIEMGKRMINLKILRLKICQPCVSEVHQPWHGVGHPPINSDKPKEIVHIFHRVN